MQNVNQGINCLSVSLSDLNVHEDGGVLNHNLRQNPTEFVPM